MKTFLYLLGFAALAFSVFFLFRKTRAYLKRDNARDKEEKAANIQGNARSAQAIVSIGSVVPPSATMVRPNGGTLDLNQLGGNIMPLYTLPVWSSLLAPNG